MIVFGEPRVGEFIAEKIGRAIYPPNIFIGWMRRGRIVAGACLNCYTGPDIEITLAAEPGGITRAFLRALGEYGFGSLGCVRCSITTDDRVVVGLAVRMGGRVEGIKRDGAGPGRDQWMLGILRSEWFLA